MNNPYDGDTRYTVTTVDGGEYTGDFDFGSVVTEKTGWWTLTLNDDEWVDLNPAHVVSVTPTGHFRGVYDG